MSKEDRSIPWRTLQSRLSQAPLEDAKTNSLKVLSQLKEDAFLQKSQLQEDAEVKPYLVAGVFHPEAFTRITWDLLGMLFIVYQAITVPYRICFSAPIQGTWTFLEFIINVVFMLDVLISFNTGFYSRGALVMNRKDITKNYLKFWFWLDLVASFPYSWFIDGVLEDEANVDEESEDNLYKAPQLLRLIKIFRFLRILKLLRLAKLKRIFIKIEDYIASNTLATLFVFFRLLSVVFFIAHWTACWWYFIGNQEMAVYPTTWVTDANLQNKPNYDKYITSLYWAFTTMTTVGYGDIIPFTVSEKIYAMFSMIVACGVFAYTVGSIGSLVSKQNAVENAYREQVVAVNRYMRKKDLPHDLQFRVRRYLEYVCENKKRNNLDEKQILGLLSEPLRDDIYAHIHGVIIKLCPIFDQYEPHFISQLTKELDNETYGPGDTVIEEGEMSTKMYFILNGNVEIYHPATKSPYLALGPREYFGEIALFTEKARCASAKCLDFVDLLSLSRTNMNSLLEKFPEAKEITELISKSCQEADFSALQVRCYICNDLGHVAIRCKMILLNLDHEVTRKKWIEKHHMKHARYINPHDDTLMYNRTPHPRVNFTYSSRNIKGRPRPSAKMYPGNPFIYPKIHGYVESYLEEKELKGADEGLEDHRSRKELPRYTMICRDSEAEAPQLDGQQPEDYRKTRTFRTSLIPKRLSSQQQQKDTEEDLEQIPPFTLQQRAKHSQVVPVSTPDN